MLVKGKAHWFKVLGDPVPAFDKTKNEWSFDLELDDESLKIFKANKALAKRIKEDDSGDRGPYTKFKRAAINSKGKENKPIPVVDRYKRDWPQDTLIGNGSEIAVQFRMIETPYGEVPSVQKVLILEHVPYDDDEFEDLYENPDEDDWDDE